MTVLDGLALCAWKGKHGLKTAKGLQGMGILCTSRRVYQSILLLIGDGENYVIVGLSEARFYYMSRLLEKEGRTIIYDPKSVGSHRITQRGIIAKVTFFRL